MTTDTSLAALAALGPDASAGYQSVPGMSAFGPRLSVRLQDPMRRLRRLRGTGITGFRNEYLRALSEKFVDTQKSPTLKSCARHRKLRHPKATPKSCARHRNVATPNAKRHRKVCETEKCDTEKLASDGHTNYSKLGPGTTVPVVHQNCFGICTVA